MLFICACGNKENVNKQEEINIPVPENNLSEIKIGEQTWAAKNLDIAVFNNGDSIPQVKTDLEWEQYGREKKPAWCYLNNNPENGKKYGRLYNWYAVNDPRGIAPEGWHIPAEAEWTKLTEVSGGENEAGAKMKATGGWYKNGNGNNLRGFSALPGGSRKSTGEFESAGLNANWWSASEGSKDNAWARSINFGYGSLNRDYHYKRYGFSVRCLKN